jgi:hypothetical protein
MEVDLTLSSSDDDAMPHAVPQPSGKLLPERKKQVIKKRGYKSFLLGSSSSESGESEDDGTTAERPASKAAAPPIIARCPGCGGGTSVRVVTRTGSVNVGRQFFVCARTGELACTV